MTSALAVCAVALSVIAVELAMLVGAVVFRRG